MISGIKIVDWKIISEIFGVEEGATNNATQSRVFDGSVVETIDINIDPGLGGATELTLEAEGGGDLTFYFGGKSYVLDCTLGISDDTPAAVQMVNGTDSDPTLNYVYVTESGGTLTLESSTVGWPATAHAPIATTLLQSIASVNSYGAYKVHAWTDHINKSTENGHLSHINKKLRALAATWVSECAGVDLASNEYLAVESGQVFQLHEHTFPALAMPADELYVVNEPGSAYNLITTVNGLTQLSDGTPIANNRYINLVLWAVVSEKDEDCQIMCNLPNGQYAVEADAQTDTNDTAEYSIPTDFTGVGFLIARYTLQAAGGGPPFTWTQSQKTDLRGLVPATSPSGGAVTDHGQLAGLADDDHPQYAGIDQTESITGDWGVGTYGSSSGGTMDLRAVTARVSQVPSSEGTVHTGTWEFTSYASRAGSSIGPSYADDQTCFRFEINGLPQGGVTPNHALEVRNLDDDVGLRLADDGSLWTAKGGSDYDWSGGLKEVACVDVDEAVTGAWAFGTSFPTTPSAAPTADYQVCNKKYVDDAGVAVADRMTSLGAVGGATLILTDDTGDSVLTGDTGALNFTGNTSYHFSGDVGVTGNVAATTIANIDDQDLVDKSANETISGLWTFGTSFPVTPSADPTTDYQVANKKYVDTAVGGFSADRLTSTNSTLILSDAGVGTNQTLTGNLGILNFAGSTSYDFSADINVTGDVGGTTIGGITQANLLDKTATESITGAYSFSSNYTRIDGGLGVGVDPSVYYKNNVRVTTQGAVSTEIALNVKTQKQTSNNHSSYGILLENGDQCSGSQSLPTYGGVFSSLVEGTTARTIGSLVGGLFSARYATGTYSNVDTTNIYCGQFRFDDPATAGTNAITNMRFATAGFTTMNDVQAITNLSGYYVSDLTGSSATNAQAVWIESQNGTNQGASKFNIYCAGGDWNTGHIQLGAAHIWFDGTNIRGKASAPGSAGDGTVIV